jgi:hypothetical protein
VRFREKASEGSVEQKRADGQEPNWSRERRASRHMTAKPIFIKDAERKSGGCALKVVELTLGDLSCVTES